MIMDEMGEAGFGEFLQWWSNEATKEMLANRQQCKVDVDAMQQFQRYAWVQLLCKHFEYKVRQMDSICKHILSL